MKFLRFTDYIMQNIKLYQKTSLTAQEDVMVQQDTLLFERDWDMQVTGKQSLDDVVICHHS